MNNASFINVLHALKKGHFSLLSSPWCFVCIRGFRTPLNVILKNFSRSTLSTLHRDIELPSQVLKISTTLTNGTTNAFQSNSDPPASNERANVNFSVNFKPFSNDGTSPLREVWMGLYTKKLALHLLNLVLIIKIKTKPQHGKILSNWKIMSCSPEVGFTAHSCKTPVKLKSWKKKRLFEWRLERSRSIGCRCGLLGFSIYIWGFYWVLLAFDVYNLRLKGFLVSWSWFVGVNWLTF